jgi:hypothetical protein
MDEEAPMRHRRACIGALLAAALPLCFVVSLSAKDRSQWADASPERRKWFESQEMNPAARARLGVTYKSCCDNGDVFRTRFRVVDDGTRYGAEQWQYLDGEVWKTIPHDIIKDEPSLDNQPILFRNRWTGSELCFFRPNGGT